MVWIQIQVGETWTKFKITPITIKTSNEIMSRIPDSIKWRTTYLSQVISEPRMSQKEWESVATGIIDIIILCIKETLKAHKKNRDKLGEILFEMDQYLSSKDNYDEKKLNNLSQQRDRLLDQIQEIEDENGIIKFSSEKIKNLRKRDLNQNLYI